MSRVFGYGRHSTDKQGLTEVAQRQKVEGYISQSLGELEYGGWVYDTAVSGKSPLFERPAGRNLLVLAQPGDHIVWAKLDRAFRSVVDGASTLAMLAHKGVFVHSLDLGLDTSTAVGRCVCTVMLAFAELEREYARDRTQAAIEAKKAAGLPYDRSVPIGWKKLGVAGSSRFVPCMEEREQARILLAKRDGGKSYDSIVSEMRKVRRPNGREWNRNTARQACRAAMAGFPKVLSSGTAPASAPTAAPSGCS